MIHQNKNICQPCRVQSQLELLSLEACGDTRSGQRSPIRLAQEVSSPAQSSLRCLGIRRTRKGSLVRRPTMASRNIASRALEVRRFRHKMLPSFGRWVCSSVAHLRALHPVSPSPRPGVCPCSVLLVPSRNYTGTDIVRIVSMRYPTCRDLLQLSPTWSSPSAFRKSCFHCSSVFRSLRPVSIDARFNLISSLSRQNWLECRF